MQKLYFTIFKGIAKGLGRCDRHRQAGPDRSTPPLPRAPGRPGQRRCAVSRSVPSPRSSRPSPAGTPPRCSHHRRPRPPGRWQMILRRARRPTPRHAPPPWPTSGPAVAAGRPAGRAGKGNCRPDPAQSGGNPRCGRSPSATSSSWAATRRSLSSARPTRRRGCRVRGSASARTWPSAAAVHRASRRSPSRCRLGWRRAKAPTDLLAQGGQDLLRVEALAGRLRKRPALGGRRGQPLGEGRQIAWLVLRNASRVSWTQASRAISAGAAPHGPDSSAAASGKAAGGSGCAASASGGQIVATCRVPRLGGRRVGAGRADPLRLQEAHAVGDHRGGLAPLAVHAFTVAHLAPGPGPRPAPPCPHAWSRPRPGRREPSPGRSRCAA